MYNLKVKTTTETEVTYNGKPVYEVLKMAADLAHEVLEELSIYRQENDLDPLTFRCEGSCCEFLDLIED
jgi:hypothetical protein